MRHIPTFVLLGGIAVLFAGCVGATQSTPNAGQAPQHPLENTYWRLANVSGRPVVVSDTLREAHLRFEVDSGGSGRVAGSTGCNRLTGPYTREGAGLRIGPAATTRMACVDPALGVQEQAILAALAATTRHSIDGDVLTLSGADGPLARFTATSMR